MVANGSLLSIKGSINLTIAFDKIEITQKFLCVDSQLSLALLGYDFISKNKVDILTSASCLLIQNVPVITQMLKSRKSVGVILNEDTSIAPHSESIIACQAEENEAHLIEQNCCLIEPDPTLEAKLDVLIARCLVTPSSTMPLRLMNVNNRYVSLKSGTKVGELKLFETTDEQLCLALVTDQQKVPSISEIIDSALQNEISILTEPEKQKLSRLLLKYESIISRNSTDLGNCKLLTHHIDTANTSPIRMAPRRIPYFQQDEVQQDIGEKEAAGIVRKSTSPWAFPIVVVRKKDGTARICVDYRRLNDVTKKDAHPLPRIDDIFDALRGAKYFSTLDLASGYHQVSVEPEDQEKTGFVTPWGHYEYTVMPFGLCNAPATFQRLMALVFSGLIGLDCLIYLDDIIIFGPTFEVHIIRLEKVFARLQAENLKIKLSKCKFGLAAVKFLGHIVTVDGIGVD
jgi:hypothetical protein